MEALLPSEIARLVFGYLEDQKCDEAARSFLEVSPHLLECRTAVLNGRRFNTRVNGYTLLDIFDKFFAAHSLVQERLSKVADCEQVRQCGDLLDQLRFLIGGSRGQRFVVNINVPSQANSQTYGGSPLISSSIRKRHYSSGSDRDRSKHTHKTIDQLFEKQAEPVSSQLGSETVEATPLESLPGHTNLNVLHRHESTTAQDSDGLYCTSTKNDSVDCPPLGEAPCPPKQICHRQRLSHPAMEQDNSSGRSERCSPDPVLIEEKSGERHVNDEENKTSMTRGKTTATSTDELRTYSSIEVQTTPYALSETEYNELEDEPIENLSLLTKELLNRTELQERIAENINKAILPIEMPSKDESICESVGGELNTSIMAELNNAIKSIVAATETDPIFEHFLDEIIGPNMDTDTSPDEDLDSKGVTELPTNSETPEEQSNTDVVDMELEKETAVIPNKSTNLNKTLEVPLKQRLRSSSRQQNVKLEEEGDRLAKEVDKTDNSLEDHNAAAILSIINANIISDKQTADRSGVVGNSTVIKSVAIDQPAGLSHIASSSSEKQVADSTEFVENDRADEKGREKLAVVKKQACKKSNSEPKVDQQDIISEQEIMAMPTLIVCSQDEGNECMSLNELYSAGPTVPCPEARFIPIAPKATHKRAPSKPSLYLKTVQVPVHVPKKIQPSVAVKTDKVEPKPASPLKMLRGNRKRNRKVTKKGKNLKSAVVSTSAVVETTESLLVENEQQHPVQSELESLTLYANDNSFGTMIETGNMPTINLDDSMTLTGAGLSPYLKFHNSKNLPQQSELPSDNSTAPVESLAADGGKADESLVLPHTENVLITRRTPKSLLKSRSKNNRLSMSTPRRRSSHIRALDFNTPTKSSSSEQKFGANKGAQFSPKSSKRVRSVCRTSLFKSPPFSNSVNISQKIRSPAKDRQLYKVPIATRSPAPKLMGGWEKYTGVGMILGGTSPHPSSTSSVFEPEEMPRSPVKPLASSSCSVKKSWDADLRQALQEPQQHLTSAVTLTKKGSAKSKGRLGKNCNANGADKISKSECGDNSDRTEPSNTIVRQDLKKIAKRDASCSLEAENVAGENNNSCQMAGTSKQVDKIGESEKLNEIPSGTTASGGGDVEVKDRRVQEIGANKRKEKPVIKKYAKLKTLQTKISKYKEKNLLDCTAPNCSTDSSQKKCDYLKISPESLSQPAHLPRMIDLETPRKADSSNGIPATPRVLSPSSSTITPFTKIAEELSKVPSFVSTPDFPPTPSIALTPKALGENTIDAIKKGEFGTCSPYYQPSNEQSDILEKLIGGPSTSNENTAEILPVQSLANVDSGAVIITGSGIVGNFSMSASTSKLEITQFEVIKENLPKKEADKELKISGSSTNAEEALPKLEDSVSSDVAEPDEPINQIIHSPPPHNGDTSSASGNESSDSSSSNTSSSSSCSSSCSCSSIATTSTPFKSATKCKKQSNVYRGNSNDCSLKNVPGFTNSQNLLSEISPIIARDVFTPSKSNECPNPVSTVSAVPRGDTSPLKMMPLIKTQEEVEASLKETPAKDEALLSEANISETPSSSKSGIECLTNLNSKISALNSLDEQSTSRQNQLTNKVAVPPQTRLKPKIISVQHLLPDVSVALKPSLLTEIVSSTTQPLNSFSILSSVTSDGKLGSHLEEKRRRLVAKLKTKSQMKPMAQKKIVKQGTKNSSCEDGDDAVQSQERKTCPIQAAAQDPASKKDAPALEKKEFRVKNVNLKAKQKANNLSDGKAKLGQAKTALAKLQSKEQNDDQCKTVQTAVEKSANLIKQKGFPMVAKKGSGAGLKGRKITRTEDPEAIQKKEMANRRISGASDPGTMKPDLNDCIIKSSTTSKEINRDLKAADSAVDSTQSSKLCDPIYRRKSTDNKPNADEECKTTVNIPVPVKKNQAAMMSKVDQIKRDLFSDEENSDQRTTRSRTRQLSDAQKNEPATAGAALISHADVKVSESRVKKPEEESENVLECLHLVPANKSETASEKISDVPRYNINEFGEFVFVFDDSAPVKKKKKEKKKLSYEISNRDDNLEDNMRNMSCIDYEELFNLSPKPKKRAGAKKVGVKGSKSLKIETLKATNSAETIPKNELTKPLTGSTAAIKSKTTVSKAGKTTGKVLLQKNAKLTDKDEKNKPKDSNQTSQKRKVTEAEEDQPLDQLVEKKRRIADPQTLLKKLDLDLFLTSVHGPV